MVEWKNCEIHCWCAHDEKDYPDSSMMRLLVKTMKESPHDHGDTTTCTGCMVDDGRLTFAVDPGRGYSVGVTFEEAGDNERMCQCGCCDDSVSCGCGKP